MGDNGEKGQKGVESNGVTDGGKMERNGYTEELLDEREGEKGGRRRNIFTLTDTATGRESRIPHSGGTAARRRCAA